MPSRAIAGRLLLAVVHLECERPFQIGVGDVAALDENYSAKTRSIGGIAHMGGWNTRPSGGKVDDGRHRQ